MTIRLIQITDLHLAQPAKYIDQTGFTTHDTLQRVITRLADETFDAVICTGDITDVPHEAAYRDAFAMLAELDKPVYCLPGNHDDANMAAPIARQYGLKWQSEACLGDWQLVFLDSRLQGQVCGQLPGSELSRLEATLNDSSSAHSLVILHHHPLPVNSQWMDKLMLQNPDELFEVVDRHASVRGLVCGHIHQELDTTRNSVRMIGSPSTCRQFTPLSDDFAVDSKPPAFRRLVLKPTGEIETEVHYCPG